jgi:hypothetical protein
VSLVLAIPLTLSLAGLNYALPLSSPRPDRNMLYAGGAIKLANIEGPNGLICQ